MLYITNSSSIRIIIISLIFSMFPFLIARAVDNKYRVEIVDELEEEKAEVEQAEGGPFGGEDQVERPLVQHEVAREGRGCVAVLRDQHQALLLHG